MKRLSIIEYSVIDYLPKLLIKEISKYDTQMLNEIRIRNGCPVVIEISGQKRVLDKIILTEQDIENIVFKVCDGSIHTYEEQIKNGYVTDRNGIRVGLAGEFVLKNDRIVSIRKYNSLCIRIPNNIKGVSNGFYNNIYKGGSVLVVSPPGFGKTTFIRDLTNNICEDISKNVVLIDERNEIAMKVKGESVFLSKSVDVLTFANKEYGFNQALRTLNPDVVVTDEITSHEDSFSIKNAIYGGVDVIATAHGNSIEDCLSRNFMEIFKNEELFDYLVFIKLNNGLREYLYFDNKLNDLCLY
ncbi:MAG: hypothetical protein E7358_02875 [Clostridiales bacterium]|nr:hypothetical protein [Clostridiales bacterium]